jgi:uncharacterized protein (DUF983 family)
MFRRVEEQGASPFLVLTPIAEFLIVGILLGLLVPGTAPRWIQIVILVVAIALVTFIHLRWVAPWIRERWPARW